MAYLLIVCSDLTMSVHLSQRLNLFLVNLDEIDGFLLMDSPVLENPMQLPCMHH